MAIERLLGVDLMATNTNFNTWGTKTNENLSAIIKAVRGSILIDITTKASSIQNSNYNLAPTERIFNTIIFTGELNANYQVGGVHAITVTIPNHAEYQPGESPVFRIKNEMTAAGSTSPIIKFRGNSNLTSVDIKPGELAVCRYDPALGMKRDGRFATHEVDLSFMSIYTKTINNIDNDFYYRTGLVPTSNIGKIIAKVTTAAGFFLNESPIFDYSVLARVSDHPAGRSNVQAGDARKDWVIRDLAGNEYHALLQKVAGTGELLISFISINEDVNNPFPAASVELDFQHIVAQSSEYADDGTVDTNRRGQQGYPGRYYIELWKVVNAGDPAPALPADARWDHSTNTLTQADGWDFDNVALDGFNAQTQDSYWIRRWFDPAEQDSANHGWVQAWINPFHWDNAPPGTVGAVGPPPRPRGMWAQAANYILGDIVRYGTSTYYAKRTNTNVVPGTSDDDWMLLNTDGAPGQAGSGVDLPRISAFAIEKSDGTAIDQSPDDDDSFAGNWSATFTVENAANVSGDLEMFITTPRGTVSLGLFAANASPHAFNLDASYVIQAGETWRFYITGTATNGHTFDRSIYVSAPAVQIGNVRFGTSDDNIITAQEIGAFGTQAYSDSQTFTIPAFNGDKYLAICQPAVADDITSIIVTGVEQIDYFTKKAANVPVNNVDYEVWVSNQLIEGSNFPRGIEMEISR